MSLELDPAELGFKRPYTHEVSQVLRLSNPHNDPIAFKVKTTAPKQYCVRPNSGKVDPGEFVEVSVVLQPMREDPPPDTRCRDKFLVQSVLVPADKEAPTWNHLEQNYKSAIQERKIRVHYLPADGSAQQINGVSEHHEDAGLTTSPPPYNHVDDSSIHVDETAIEQPVKQETFVNTSSSSQISREELEQRLAEANAIVAKLKRENDEAGLRRRKEDISSKGLTTGSVDLGVPVHQQSGLSVQTVAIISLIVFLLTYLLF